MKSLHDNWNYVLKLDKGELLVRSIVKFVKENELTGGWINVIGGAQWAELGFYHLEKQLYDWQKVDKPLEIVSVMGNIAWFEEEPLLHLHGNFADDQMKTYGGHLKEAEVAGTAEVFIHVFSDKLSRQHDQSTGLNLLNL